jgi:hypothetical protein
MTRYRLLAHSVSQYTYIKHAPRILYTSCIRGTIGALGRARCSLLEARSSNVCATLSPVWQWRDHVTLPAYAAICTHNSAYIHAVGSAMQANVNDNVNVNVPACNGLMIIGLRIVWARSQIARSMFILRDMALYLRTPPTRAQSDAEYAESVHFEKSS